MSDSKHTPEPQCCQKVLGDRDYHGHVCYRRGVVEREGKWYCKQHDPVARQEREDARRAKQDAKWAKIDQHRKRTDACEEACKGMTDPVAEVQALKAKLENAKGRVANIIATANRNDAATVDHQVIELAERAFAALGDQT